MPATEGRPVLYSFISGALLWVIAQVGPSGPLPAPTVQWASQEEMVRVAAAADPAMRNHIRDHGLRLGGLYLPDRDKIYLLDSLDLDDPRHQSILVHELVHYVQDQLGVTGTVQQLEDQAYALQERWLREQAGR